MASTTRKTYIGVTTNLERRVWEHQSKTVPGHTSKYNEVLLVYLEEHSLIEDAITTEKQLKKWSVIKKHTLIAQTNPDCLDLSTEWRT